MTHLPYVAASYGLAVALVAWLGVAAAIRTASARRRLLAIDPRADRGAA